MNRRRHRAAGLGSHTAAGFHEAGLRHLGAGQYLDAQICCQQAFALDSGHAGTLHLQGLLSLHARQYDVAVEWIASAIRQDPRPEYLSSLGTVLRHQGRNEEALKTFDKAVQLKPDDAELWKNLGMVLSDLARPADALLSFQHALKLNPRDWDAANHSGFLLYRSGRHEEALRHFDLCDELQPGDASTLQARALALGGLKRFEEALADSRRAHALDPGNVETRNNIGDALQSLGRYQEALVWFDEALKLRPDLVEALNNKLLSLGQLRRFDEASAISDGMKARGLNDAVTDWNMSLLHMLTGNFEAGWAGREARWKTRVRTAAYPAFAQPVWLGEGTLEGKTILVHVDEGIGDSIQFARYLPMLAARAARVILVVADALCPLLSKLPGVSQCLAVSAATLPAFDMHCPMSSLPLAFGTRLDTIPSGRSYLPAPDEGRVLAWQTRLGAHDRLRVGLVWSGNPDHGNDHSRSIPLRALSRIFDVDATLVSLQKDPRPDDAAALRERTDILDLTAHLSDFSETAALIACLDLVITVDTSVAHLAGALACPTWILLPYAPDYRWLLDRDDSPWYPTMRLFRQDEARDYAPVLDRVRTELLALVSANRPS
jgi:tetratricopeptide (TPR) repeat protein